ncbi:MAG TPA: 30S ribosomal protein S17, partial [Fervidobacterium nodosum]|nr:30S ribosomal protein S17 [Fervidobacterium nodosum]
VVEIEESRPLSKLKRWVVVNILERSKLSETPEIEETIDVEGGSEQ